MRTSISVLNIKCVIFEPNSKACDKCWFSCSVWGISYGQTWIVNKHECLSWHLSKFISISVCESTAPKQFVYGTWCKRNLNSDKDNLDSLLTVFSSKGMFVSLSFWPANKWSSLMEGCLSLLSLESNRFQPIRGDFRRFLKLSNLSLGSFTRAELESLSTMTIFEAPQTYSRKVSILNCLGVKRWGKVEFGTK